MNGDNKLILQLAEFQIINYTITYKEYNQNPK